MNEVSVGPIRTPRAESGTEGLTRFRARGKNHGPLRTNEVHAGRIRARATEQGPTGRTTAPAERIRAPRDGSGPCVLGHELMVLQDESGLRGTKFKSSCPNPDKSRFFFVGSGPSKIIRIDLIALFLYFITYRNQIQKLTGSQSAQLVTTYVCMYIFSSVRCRPVPAQTRRELGCGYFEPRAGQSLCRPLDGGHDIYFF